MPITEELKNIKKLESVGFNHEQAEALTDIVEQAQINGQEGLKEFIRSELNNLDNKLSGEINSLDNKIGSLNSKIESEAKSLSNELIKEIKDLELRNALSQKDLLVKIFGIIVGTVGIAVTILKLFP